MSTRSAHDQSSHRSSTSQISRRQFASLSLFGAGIGWSGWRAGAAAQGTPLPGEPVKAPFLTLAPLPEGMPRQEPLAVVASMGIVADLVQQIGGQRVRVKNLLPPNRDPHDFEPSPQDAVAIEDADLVATYGLGLDQWATTLLEEVGEGRHSIVISDGVPTRAAESGEEHEGDEEHEHGEVDPHAWFDPTLVKTMVATIAGGLGTVDPEGSQTYAERLAGYQEQLDQLDQAIFHLIDLVPAENRVIVTNHDSLGYFAARYGLEIVGTVIPGLDTRSEPSAEEVDALLDLIEERGVRAIFAENTTGAELAQELAQEAGVTVVDMLYTDSLGEAGSGVDTYLGLMQTDTAIIVNALRPSHE